jgi:hypothetical protein
VNRWRELVIDRKKWKEIVQQGKAHSGLWCQKKKKEEEEEEDSDSESHKYF